MPDEQPPDTPPPPPPAPEHGKPAHHHGRPELPSFRFIDELKRRNVGRVAILYIVVGYVALEVFEVFFHLLELPAWAGRVAVLAMVVGLPLVLIFAWAYEATPEGLKPTGEVVPQHSIRHQTGKRLDRAIIGVLAIALAYFVFDKFWLAKYAAGKKPSPPVASAARQSPSAISDRSIAVLPFTDMSEKRDQEYFAEGLSEELIDRLTAVPELHVAARTSSFFFKGKSDDIPTIARRLMVANILQGSIRKSGSRMRITVQLVRADNGYQLWSETFERQLGDVFKLQDDIAVRVLQTLKASFVSDTSSNVTGNPNSEAYILLTQARALERRGAANLPAVVEYLQRAISLDSDYAPAWAELATVRVYQSGGSTISTYNLEAHRAATQALTLQPNLAAAHVAIALVRYNLDWDWEGAEQAFGRALELEPRNADILSRASLSAMTLGNLDEARSRLQRALDADPLNSRAHIYLGYMDYYDGRFPQAEAAWQKGAELDPEWTEFNSLMGLARLAEGNGAAALSLVLREPREQERTYGLAFIYFSLGRTAEANTALAKYERDNANDSAYDIAQIHAYRHEVDQAFLWLERAFRQRDQTLPHIKGDPLLKNLESDPRYGEFLRKMKLPQ